MGKDYTPPKTNWKQKQAFSIIYGLKRFRQYLLGRTTLLGPDRPVPVHAAARIQRWASSHFTILQL